MLGSSLARTLPLVGVLAALAVSAACGGQPAAEARNGEASAVVYTDDRYHYRIDAPGQMKAGPDGRASVIGPSERLEVAVIEGAQAADPGALARADVTGLSTSLAGFQLKSGPTSITLGGKRVEKLVYRYNAGASQVTGKPIDLVGVRYYIPRDASTLAVVSYGIAVNEYDPQGADDVANSFRWQ